MTNECTGWNCPMMNVDVKRCTAKWCPYRTKEDHKVDELIGLRIAIDFLSSVVKIIEDDRRNRKNGGRDNADPD